MLPPGHLGCVKANMNFNNPMDLSNLLNPESPEVRTQYARDASYSVPCYRRDSTSTTASLSYDRQGSFSDSSGFYATPPCSEPAHSPGPSSQHTFESPRAHPNPLPNTPPAETKTLALHTKDEHDIREQQTYQPQDRNEVYHGVQLPLVGMMNLDIKIDLRKHPSQRFTNRPDEVCDKRDRPRQDQHMPHTPRRSTHRDTSYAHYDQKLLTQKDRRAPKSKIRRAPKGTDADGKRDPHSNKKYTQEQVDYIRYMKDDLGYSYGDIQTAFNIPWPQDKRESDQCFSSRTYRDHVIPVLKNGRWELDFDEQGRVVTKKNPVRKRDTEEFRNVPFKLIERSPWRIQGYDWVRPEDKKRARRIMEQDERDYMRGSLTGERSPNTYRGVVLIQFFQQSQGNGDTS